MKILVVGGQGFLGQHLVKKLQNNGHRVFVYDLNKNKKIKGFTFIKGNILDKNKLDKFIKGMDVVYNFAAISDIEQSIREPLKTAEINILGNFNILLSCIKYKVKKFIFASTIYVHSSQGSFYRASKQSSELFIEEFRKRFGLNYTILRFGTVYGTGSGKNNGLNKMVYSAVKKNKLQYSGSKNAKRRFLHVSDAVNACVKILNKKYNNQNILITGRKIIKVEKVLNKIKKILQIKSKMNFKNFQGSGHYDKNPYNYEPKKDKKILLKSEINLTQGIIELINEIKKNKK